MLDSIQGRIFKKTLKAVAVTALDAASMVLDKGAELADEGKDYIKALDVKDTSARKERQEKRNNES